MKSVAWRLAFAAAVGAACNKAVCSEPEGVGMQCDNLEGTKQLVQTRKQTPEPLLIQEAANARRNGCQNCCNDGQKVVPCLDVDACAANGPQQGKYALVFSYSGKPPQKFFPNILHVRKYATWADFILLMTKEDAKLLDKWQLRTMYLNDVKLRTVDWAVPPNMLHHPEKDWCGPQDLTRLHALGLEGYDAVAYYDNDIEIQGDITPMLRCAATGRLLTTNGGVGEPLNVGFFAVRPDSKLLEAAISFAQLAPFDREGSGWAGAGFAPAGGYFIGAECGQGFFHTLFYKTASNASQFALAEVGLGAPGALVASQIDRCIWNYQTSFQCSEDFDCSRVRAHHKPDHPGSNPKECMKSNVRWSPVSMAQRSTTFGFWFPIFQQEANVLRVVRQVRRHYPDSPIMLLTDGGQVDFTDVCKLPRYRCIFERTAPENSRWNPHSWFRRMRDAAQKIGTDYMIYLEPDVMVTKRHEIDPPFDAGGVFDNFNPGVGAETVDYLERLGQERNPGFRMRWYHFGLTGGTYLRTEAILDAFHPDNIARLDFPGLFRKEGDKVWSSDLSMHLALSARGWVVYPWQEAAQRFDNVPEDDDGRANFRQEYPAWNPQAAFQHDHKERYGEAVPEEENKLLVGFSDPTPPDVTCHGCLWYIGDYRLPIPSEAPPVQNSMDKLDAVLPGLVAAVQAGQNDDELPVGARGLNIDVGMKPAWLKKEDGLVVDTRWNKEQGGGILLAQTILSNKGGDFGIKGYRSRWLRAILATNGAHIRRNNHAMALRWQPTQPQLTPWQLEKCAKENKNTEACGIDNERENFNWEKHLMLSEYLESPERFSYVMMLDADAALVRTDHNTLGEMAATLEMAGKDLLVANEDWLLNGEERVNGGLLFARNTPWTRKLFRNLFDCHYTGFNKDLNFYCTSNEQIVLNDLMSRPNFPDHILVTSGKKFNRGGCTVWGCGEGISDERMTQLGMADPALEVLHFMGASKFGAANAICSPKDLTEAGPDGYGCKE